MSHFYGKLQGKSPKTLTRCGTAKSGLTATAASWSGAVQVTLHVWDGVDYACVSLIPWEGKGTERVLYVGPIAG